MFYAIIRQNIHMNYFLLNICLERVVLGSIDCSNKNSNMMNLVEDYIFASEKHKRANVFVNHS